MKKHILPWFLSLTFCLSAFGQTITLSSTSQIAAANVCKGKVKHAIYQFQLQWNSGGSATLDTVRFTTNGSYASTDISRFQLWHSITNNFAAATQLGPDKLDTLGPGTRNLDSLGLLIDNANPAHFFWITTDIQAGAIAGNTIRVPALTTGSFFFNTAVTLNGSATIGGLQTIVSLPSCNITGSSSVCAGSTSNSYSGPGSVTNYAWSISGNGTIVGAATNQSVSVNAGVAGSYTLILTTTNSNACSNTCQQAVTVNANPTCSITGSTAVCAGSTGNSYSGPAAGVTAYAWSITGNGTIVGGATNQAVSVTAGAAGTYTLTLTTTNANSCSTTCQQAVTVNANPSCTITGNTTVCAASTGNSYSGPAGVTSYSWSISGNGTIIGAATNQSASVTAGSAGSFTLTLTTTNSNSCSATCQQAVTVGANPACNITGSSGVCENSLNNSYSAPAGMTTYAWSISGNATIIGATTNQLVTVTAGSAGTFTLSLTVTISISCSSNCTQIVTVNPNPNCSITGSNSVCENSTGNSYSAPGSMASYSWSISGNGTIIGATTNQSVTVTAGSPGSFTLSLTITNSNSCSSTCTNLVTVNANPACAINGSNTVCENSTSNSFSGTAGMSTYTWGISGSGTIIGATTNQSVTANAGSSGSFTLTLTIVNSNGCSSTCQKLVTISNPICLISGNDTVCETSSGNTYTAPSAMSSYAWTIVGNGAISGASNTQSVNVTSGSSGSFTLTVTITDANSCSSTCQLTVAVFNPVCSITGSNSVCQNSTSHSYAGTAGMASYAWGISGNGTISGASNGQSVIVNAGSAGSYTLTLTITDANSCSSTCQNTVIVNANPTCSITGGNAICQNATGITYTSTPGMTNYSWSISGNGTISGASNGQSVIVNGGSAGTFTLTITITDANSCSSTCQKVVTVNPNPVCSVTGSNSVCESSPNNSYSGSAGMNNYAWSITGNGTINGPANGQTVAINAGLAGSYTITLLITDANSCSSTCQNAVTVKPLPPNVTVINPNGEQVDLTVCSGSQNIPYALNVATSSNVSWISNPSSVLIGDTNAINNVITFPDSAVSYSASISVVIHGANGCSNATTLTVQVNTGSAPVPAPIIKKDIGNGPILIYTDPSVRGYRWGVDSVDLNNKIINSAFLAGQVYQAFVPPSKFLNGLVLDTINYWYWVMAYDPGSNNDTCKTKVYYNGLFMRQAVPEEIPDEIIAIIAPNPNEGNFNLKLQGNIYGNISVNIYDMMGRNKLSQTFNKNVASEYFQLQLGQVAAGLYSLSLTGENGEIVVVKFIVKN